MGIGMQPEDMHAGAQQLDTHAEMLQGHMQNVAELTALRSAFAGAGELAWPTVEAKLAELDGRLQHAHQQATNHGQVLRTAADGTVAIDGQQGQTLRGTSFDA